MLWGRNRKKHHLPEVLSGITYLTLPLESWLPSPGSFTSISTLNHVIKTFHMLVWQINNSQLTMTQTAHRMGEEIGNTTVTSAILGKFPHNSFKVPTCQLQPRHLHMWGWEVFKNQEDKKRPVAFYLWRLFAVLFLFLSLFQPPKQLGLGGKDRIE